MKSAAISGFPISFAQEALTKTISRSRNDTRRRGIAPALINRLRAVARDIVAYLVFVQADRGDTPAIRLYESLGSREDVLHFDIEP